MLQKHNAKHVYKVPEGLRELCTDISREVSARHVSMDHESTSIRKLYIFEEYTCTHRSSLLIVHRILGTQIAAHGLVRIRRRIRGYAFDNEGKHKRWIYRWIEFPSVPVPTIFLRYFYPTVQENILRRSSRRQSRKQYITWKPSNPVHTLPGRFYFGADSSRGTADPSKFYYSVSDAYHYLHGEFRSEMFFLLLRFPESVPPVLRRGWHATGTRMLW